jgi:hypothetical protein
MPREVLERVVGLCAERDAVLFCDEVYRELEHDPARRLPAACDLYERAVSLGSVSKTYGLPGLRTGWIACRDAALRDAVVATKLYTTICSSAPSELLAAVALRNRNAIVERNRALVLENSRTRMRSSSGTPTSSTGSGRMRRRSASRAWRSAAHGRSASGSRPRRASSSCPATSTTSRATCGSGSGGWALETRSGG